MPLPELINSINTKVKNLKLEASQNAPILYFLKALSTPLKHLDFIQNLSKQHTHTEDYIIYNMLKYYKVYEICEKIHFPSSLFPSSMITVEELLSHGFIKNNYPEFYNTFNKVCQIREDLHFIAMENASAISEIGDFSKIPVSVSRNIVAGLIAEPIIDLNRHIYFFDFITTSNLLAAPVSMFEHMTEGSYPYFMNIHIRKTSPSKDKKYDTRHFAIPLTKLFKINGIYITKNGRESTVTDLIGYTVNEKDFTSLLNFYSEILDIYSYHLEKVTKLVSSFDGCKLFKIVNSI